MQVIEELPAYLHCDDCDERHYLSVNKDIQGKWSIGYVEYATHTAIHTANSFETIDEAAKSLKEYLDYDTRRR